jgi:hypothetical protein
MGATQRGSVLTSAWGPIKWERGFDPGVFGRFDLAALAHPHLQMFLLFCLGRAGLGDKRGLLPGG